MLLVYMVTPDILEIWLNPTEENAKRIVSVVNEFGFSSYKLVASDFTAIGNIIQLGYPPLRIDLLNDIDGVSFSECYANRKDVSIEGLSVNFIGYHDLLKNKKESGRHRDLDDLENLSES